MNESFYIILSGSVAFSCDTLDSEEVGVGIVGTTFGDLPYMKPSTYAYRAVAKDNVECAIISRREAKDVMTEFEESDHSDTIAFLKSHPLLVGWSRPNITKLCNSMKKLTYPAKSVVIKQGEDSVYMYFLKKGCCAVIRDTVVTTGNQWPSTGGGTVIHKTTYVKQTIMSYLQENSYFGENGVLTGDKRYANVVAETRVQVLALHKRDFSLLEPGHTLKNIKKTIRK